MPEPDGTPRGPPVNWQNHLELMKREYETEPAKGLAHGLQKDAIQNGWGARRQRDGKGWSFAIRLLRTADGNLLLTMTDAGTVGLIGKLDYWKTVEDPNEDPPSTERLARFESMYFSGGREGPGLFGRGKLLFNAASRTRLIYYDSLTVDGKYRLGKRQITGRIFDQPGAIEGEVARKGIREWTGGALEPLSVPGTRITIVSPATEVVEAIRNGSFLRAIEETWWEIIQKYAARIVVEAEAAPAEVAVVPPELGPLPATNERGWRVYRKENVVAETGGEPIKIKRIHMLIAPGGWNVPEDLRGVSIHRAGMKIGPVTLGDVPAEVANRFFGYVQIDDDSDEIVSVAENATHYGFALRGPYRALKRCTEQHLEAFLDQEGLRGEKSQNEKDRKVLENAAAELNAILNSESVPGIGAGQQRGEGIFITVKGLGFPEGGNNLSKGAKISGFHYEIANNTGSHLTAVVKVFTHSAELEPVDTLVAGTAIELDDGAEHRTDRLTITVGDGYETGRKYACTAQVLDQKKEALASKSFYFYVEGKPEKPLELAKIRLAEAAWPRKSKRVNVEESIRDVTFEIENCTANSMAVRVKVNVIWPAHKIELAEVAQLDDVLEPFESKRMRFGDVTFDRATYDEVGKDRLVLRCTAAATEATPLWEKAARLGRRNFTVYLNMDPSYGFFAEIEPFEGGAGAPRSEAMPLGSSEWKFRLNTTHPAYKACWELDPERAGDYAFEEMVRQTIYVLLSENRTDVALKLAGLEAGTEIASLEPERLIEDVGFRVGDKLLAKYYGGA